MNGIKGRTKPPKWDLQRVKKLTKEGKLFVQRKRALDFFQTAKEAIQAVKGAIEDLSDKDYAGHVEQIHDVLDVYGIRRGEEQGWMLKLCIDESEPEVAVVSFHPLERPLKTRGGTVKP